VFVIACIRWRESHIPWRLVELMAMTQPSGNGTSFALGNGRRIRVTASIGSGCGFRREADFVTCAALDDEYGC